MIGPRSLGAQAWPRDRREAVGLGLYLGQLVTIFGIALSYGLLCLSLLTAWWATRGRLVRRLRAVPGAALMLWPLGLYFLLTVAAVAMSVRPGESAGALGEFLALSPLVLALLFVRGEKQVRLLVLALIGLGVLLSLLGLVEYLRGGLSLDLNRRVSGPLSHYQTLAGVLLLCDLQVIAALAYRRELRRWWMVLALVLISLVLLLGLTRGAWVALAASVALLLFVRAPRALLVVVPAAVALLLLLPGRIVERVTSIPDLQNLSNYDRICMAYSGLKMIEERPFFGVGPQLVGELYPIYRHPTAPRIERPHLHNAYLEVAAERGVPALLALLTLFAGSGLVAWRELRREGRGGGPRSDLWMGVVLGLVAFCIAGLFEDNWGDTEVQRVLLFLLAAPFCLRNEPPSVTPEATAA